MQNFIKTMFNSIREWTKSEIFKSESKLKKQINENKSDWAQNDEGANGYIKNRTHWTEGAEEVLVDNLTREDYENGNKPQCTFIVGDKYDVIWNGTLYEGLECHLEGVWRVIASPEAGQSFYINDDGGNNLYISNADGNWIVSIIKQAKVHKLDVKYLPDEAATIKKVNEIANQKITYSTIYPTISGFSKINLFTQKNGLYFILNNKVNTSGIGYTSSYYYSIDGVEWTVGNFPSGTYWQDIEYNNGMYVAISSDNIAAYSTDGINWELAPKGAGNNGKIVCGDNVFLAIGTYTTPSFYSKDGINWNSTGRHCPSGMKDITYGQGKFIGISYDGNGYSSIWSFSIDQPTTRIKQIEDNFSYGYITYVNDKFIITADDRIYYSEDGEEWFEKPLPNFDLLGKPIFANNMYVMWTGNSYAYSYNGIDWYQNTIFENMLQQKWLFYKDGAFVIFDYTHNALSSRDLIHWEEGIPQLIMLDEDITNEVSNTLGISSHLFNTNNPHNITPATIGAIPTLEEAQIGQSLVVKSVDENNKPTEWEYADVKGTSSWDDLEDKPTKLSSFENDTNYATETFVTNKIAEAELGGEEVDLSGYATKDEIKDFIKEVPAEYVTETELEAKGYLTQHQDISGKLDKTELTSAINTALAQAKASGEFKGVGIKSIRIEEII